MDNMVKVTIDIPTELLSEVEEQSRLRGESVSQFFSRAAQTLLRRHKERRMLEEYVEARTKMPNPEEVDEARRKLQGPSER